MTRAATAKLRAYPVLAGLGLIGALVLGRPELAAVAAPFAVLVGVGLTLARPPELRVTADLDRERQLEGRTVLADVELRSARPVWRLELLLDLPAGLEAEAPNPVLIRLAPGERRDSRFLFGAATGAPTRSEGFSGARGTIRPPHV